MRWLTRLLSAAVLIGAAVVLAVCWDRIPTSWVIHWGIGGHPNGWTSKSVAGVFGLLVFGAVLVVLIEGLSLLGTKGRPAVLARAAQELVGWINLGVAIVFATLAVWLPLGQPHSSVLIALLTLGVMITSLFVGLVRFGRAAREFKAQGVAGIGGYHGVYYSNPKDARLWVPKLVGAGWTLNFAHRWAWPMLFLLLSPVLAIIAVVIATTTR